MFCGEEDSDDGTRYFCTLPGGHPDNGDGTITHRTEWPGPDPDDPGRIPYTYVYSHEWTVAVTPPAEVTVATPPSEVSA